MVIFANCPCLKGKAWPGIWQMTSLLVPCDSRDTMQTWLLTDRACSNSIHALSNNQVAHLDDRVGHRGQAVIVGLYDDGKALGICPH